MMKGNQPYIWPEWNDQIVNDTSWNPVPQRSQPFSDPINHGVLPPSIHVTKWRRPVDIYNYPNTLWKIGDEKESFDLIFSNQHLFEHKIMRWIISSIMCLEKIGRQNPCDLVSFLPNTPGTPEWKPWHHIYAGTKIVKGLRNQPKYNPMGMYYIRLFYMGKWRRITVDDYFPYDKEGRLLLPCTRNKHYLWLQILSKALLRLASESWVEGEDVIDFSVITCFTGWTQYTLDCRSISTDNMWKVIKLNLFEKLKENQNEKKYCLTYDTITCITKKENFECDNNSARVVIGVLNGTTGKIKGIPLVGEHIIYFCSAMKKPIDGDKDLPKWKKLRWINWALENNVINTSPGSFLQIVSIYTPFSEVVTSYLPKEPGQSSAKKHLFSEEMFSIEGNIFKLLGKEQIIPEIPEKKEVIEDSLEFNFAEIYPYLRQLEIYYRPQNFLFKLNTNDIETLVNKLYDGQEYAEAKNATKFTSKRKTGGTKSEHLRNTKGEKVAISEDKNKSGDSIDFSIDYSIRFREPCHLFYIFSDTKYCKNIYITLSITRDSNMKYGYIICEKYDWKSVALGPLLVGMKTVGTKTCILQLGPGMQVCRVHYYFPKAYELTISSETNFTVLNIYKLHSLLSTYSVSVISQGDKMLTAFKEILPRIQNTSGHIKFLSVYKEMFYPPGYKDLTIALQLKLSQDFDEVFADAFTKHIFDSALPLHLKTAVVDGMKVIFRNELFGEQFLENLDQCTLRDIATARKNLAIANIHSFLPELTMLTKTMNELYKKISIESLILTKPSKMKVAMDFDSESDMVRSMYFTSEMHIEVLRRILNTKPEYLQLYPFMNDHYLFLKYQDHKGITEVTLVHNCFAIARLTLNIHSTKAVPCNITAEVEFPKAVLHVVDADKCERLSFPFGLSATLNLKRNKIGYTLLLCGYCGSDMLGKPLSLAWRIRILGVDNGNILHTCDSINPYYCQLNTPNCEKLHAVTISGFYVPSTEKIIGRFIIGVTKSVLATLFVSVSNEQVELSLIIKGANDEIITKAEGKGCIFVPVVLLEQSCGECSPEFGEKSRFMGTIYLKGEWFLTSKELAFANVVKSSSQKDAISFKEFCEDNATSGSNCKSIERKHYTAKFDTEGSSNNLINSEDNETISSNISLSEESNLKIKEDPYGIFGAAPQWKLSVIVDVKDEVHTFVDNDFIRYDVFQDLKTQWLIEDPKRLTKGKRLREDFLNVNRTDFMNLQLDPDNISISDFSEAENNESSEEESLLCDISNSQEFKTITYEGQTTYPSLLLSSNLTENIANNTLLNDVPFVLNQKSENTLSQSTDKLHFDKIQSVNNSTSRKLHIGKFSHSDRTDEQKLKMIKNVSINKIIARSKKQFKDIIFQEDGNSKQKSEYIDIACPQIPSMTETLIKEYSLPLSKKPILKEISPMEDDTSPLTQEEFENICSKKKVSLSRVYKKFVAPILWGISKSKTTCCLKDLPIQAYSQKRYSNKLENTLMLLKNKTNLAMYNEQNQILAAEAYFQRRSNADNGKK